jgi:hypothetical protein
LKNVWLDVSLYENKNEERKHEEDVKKVLGAVCAVGMVGVSPFQVVANQNVVEQKEVEATKIAGDGRDTVHASENLDIHDSAEDSSLQDDEQQGREAHEASVSRIHFTKDEAELVKGVELQTPEMAAYRIDTPTAIKDLFPDVTLAGIIAEKLNKEDTNQTVSQAELSSIKSIYSSYPTNGEKINSLEGSEHLNNLQSLVISGHNVTDMTPITRLYSLKELVKERVLFSSALILGIIIMRVMSYVRRKKKRG